MITKELGSTPSSGPLLAKAALGALPLPLPWRGRRCKELPDTELVLPEVRVDAEHLAAYARACGFRMRDELPVTYPHVLAFPLALQLMTDGSFPFPMIGLVHVNNTITQHRPLRLGEPFGLRVRTADLRPHDKGRQFDVIHEATVDGEVVWRDVSTYLRRGGSASAGGGQGGQGGRDKDRPVEEQPPATAVWRIADDIGRRYAAVSGDRNPIHLHALTARAFGFRRAIAHGMWTKARCVAAMESRLPAGYTVDVAFKLPVLLPAKVAFTSTPEGGGWRFTLRDARSGKPHLNGAIDPA